MNTPEKEYLKELLTVKEFLTVMGISEKTFYVNRMAEKLPGYKIEKSKSLLVTGRRILRS